MGKSKSIEDLSAKNKEFQKYIDDLKDQLQKKSNDAQENMTKEIEKFYKDNNYKKEEYIFGMNSDFMQKYEWSLANVNKIIIGIQKAMFGESTPPEGVTLEKTSTAISESIKAMADLKSYILGKSFQIITGAVEAFGNSTEVHYNSQFKHETLGNGFHLFATVVSDSFKSASFFQNEEICEYLYIYRVCFSVQEAQSQGKMMAIKTYEDQIAVFSAKLEECLNKLAHNEYTPEQYSTYKQIYQNLMDDSQKQLKDLEAIKLNKERAEKLEAKEQEVKKLNANLFI